MEVLSRLMTRSLGETYQTKRESVRYVTDDDFGWGVNLSFWIFLVKKIAFSEHWFQLYIRIKPPLQLLYCTVHLYCPFNASHIYQSVVDSLVHVARHLQDGEQRYELMMKALQVFVQQGIEAKRASEKADVQTTHKVKHWCWHVNIHLLYTFIGRCVHCVWSAVAQNFC